MGGELKKSTGSRENPKFAMERLELSDCNVDNVKEREKIRAYEISYVGVDA